MTAWRAGENVVEQTSASGLPMATCLAGEDVEPLCSVPRVAHGHLASR